MSLSISAYVTAVQMGRLLFGRILRSAAPVAAATVAAFAASAAAAGLKRAAASKRWPLPPRWPADKSVFSQGVSEFRWQTRCALPAVRSFRRQSLKRP